MTYFVKIENGNPVSNAIAQENFQQLFPQFSNDTLYTPDIVEPLGYGIYDFSNQPQPDRYQKIIEAAPTKNEFGIWKQTWQLVEMSNEEKAEADAKAAIFVRSQRNHRLLLTDWVVVKHLENNQSIPSSWQAYRQALRDVPAQQGFPWNVTWPNLPGA